jgi:hypothetical protein
MIFGKKQIEDIMEMIDFQHLHFFVFNVSVKPLSRDEVSLLKKFGIDVKKIKLPQFSPTKKAFLFGKLAASLKDQASKIDYNDFLKYLRRGQFVPLNKAEENVLELLERRLKGSIDRQCNRVKQDIQNLLVERDLKWNLDQSFKDLVNKEVQTAFKENRSKQEIVLELGAKTENWERDLGRIAETEFQDIYQYGKLASYSERTEDGEDFLVYKNVYAGACKSCISLYLSNGAGSEPVLYKMSELIKNGTNIGRTQKEWLPVVGTTHCFCRCELEHYEKGDEWDRQKQVYTIPKSRVDEARQIKGEIVITVGDKIIRV